MGLPNTPEKAHSSLRSIAVKHDPDVFLCQGQTAVITSGRTSREIRGIATTG